MGQPTYIINAAIQAASSPNSGCKAKKTRKNRITESMAMHKSLIMKYNSLFRSLGPYITLAPLSRRKWFYAKAIFVYLQRVGAKKKSLLFGKRSLIPAFVFQSLPFDHKSTSFKIKHLIQPSPWTEAYGSWSGILAALLQAKVTPLLHISTVQPTNVIQRRTHLAKGAGFSGLHQAFKNIALIQGCWFQLIQCY